MRDSLGRMPLQTLNHLITAGLFLLATLGTLTAVYEGKCWAYRQPGLSRWTILSPARLFRPSLYTERGNELRRVAIRLLVAFVLSGVLLVVGILYRNWLEHAA